MARRVPSLRAILLGVALVILLLPLGGVVLLRLYESVLVRRTEAELVAQGAVLAPMAREHLKEALGEAGRDPSTWGVPAVEPPRATTESEPFRPVPPRLDLARDPVLPDAPAPVEAPREAEAPALQAGAALTPLLREIQRTTLAGIRVTDPRGVVVASTRGELGLSLLHRGEVARALRGETVTLMRERLRDEPPPALDSISRSTQIRVFVAMPILSGEPEEGPVRIWGAVVLSRTPMSVLQSLYGIRWYLAWGALAVLILAGLVIWTTSRTIARPVEELIARTEGIARQDPAALRPLERPGTREVERLSEAIIRMGRALRERGEYISAFAASVSHEFKTPLASMRGAVELLRDHLEEMKPEERERFLANLEQDTRRLEDLVNRLLDLARADTVRPGEAKVDVGRELERIAERLADEGLGVSVVAPRGLEVRMGPEALEAVVRNLADNARQHGGPDVEVVLEARAAGRDAEIAVTDDGPGISEANLPRIFDRFFTTARGRGGSGLGLAIVRALVEAHQGSVTVTSRPGETRFLLRVPAAAGSS